MIYFLLQVISQFQIIDDFSLSSIQLSTLGCISLESATEDRKGNGGWFQLTLTNSLDARAYVFILVGERVFLKQQPDRFVCRDICLRYPSVFSSSG